MGKNDAIIMICCMMEVWRGSRGGGKKTKSATTSGKR